MSVKRVAVAALVAILSWGSVTSGEEGEGSMLLDTVRAGRLAEVRSMLGKADLEARDAQGRTALLLATHANNVEIARALIDAGADVNAKDHIKDTPFLYAGAEGRDEILKLILATERQSSATPTVMAGPRLSRRPIMDTRQRWPSCFRQASTSTTSTISAGQLCWRR